MNAAPDHRQAEARRLAAIRGQLDALGAAEWQLAADGGPSAGSGLSNMMVETSMQVAGGVDRVLLCRFGAHATSDEMQFVSEAKFNIAFLLELLDRAIRKLRSTPTPSPSAPPLPLSGGEDGRGGGDGASSTPGGGRGGAGEARDGVGGSVPNYAAEAAIKCGEPAFRVFLEERHGLSFDQAQDEAARSARAAQKLRSLLGVTSRRDLNSDEQAAARWKDLRREFDVWRKDGG